ncbi:MAG: DUF2290 domain-containing protein [Myxococcota bacterium]
MDEANGVWTISWKPAPPGHLFRLAHDRLDSYPAWVAEQAFSAVLLDGALIQLTWSIVGGEVTAHRLAYIPCPLVLDPDLLKTEPLLDVWDLAMDSSVPEVILRSAIRFDFDPVAAAPGHPASHLTFNDPECRIAVAHPLGPNEFFRFVFRNFYPDIWHRVTYLQSLKQGFDHQRTLVDDECEELHLRWERSRR